MEGACAVRRLDLPLDQLRSAAVDICSGEDDSADGRQPRGADALRARLERRPERAVEVATARAELDKRVDLCVRDARAEDLSRRRVLVEQSVSSASDDLAVARDDGADGDRAGGERLPGEPERLVPGGLELVPALHSREPSAGRRAPRSTAVRVGERPVTRRRRAAPSPPGRRRLFDNEASSLYGMS
jgi:hypothetical protein